MSSRGDKSPEAELTATMTITELNFPASTLEDTHQNSVNDYSYFLNQSLLLGKQSRS